MQQQTQGPVDFDGADSDAERGLAASVCTVVGSDLVDARWGNIALGIMLAGGVYPVLLAFCYLVVVVIGVLWIELWQGAGIPTLSDGAVLLWSVVLTICATGLLGIAWAGFVALFALPLLYVFAWSLRLRGSAVVWGAFCGGLVGFLAVLPVMLSVGTLDDTMTGVWMSALALIAGPGVTTVVGQVGGAWGGHRGERLDRSYDAIIARPDAAVPGGQNRSSRGETAPIRSSGWSLRFGIRHLLWLAAWTGLLLCAIRMSGIPFEYILPLLLGWLAYQAASLWAVWRIYCRWNKKGSSSAASRST